MPKTQVREGASMKPYYMIVWKPLGSQCWTPVSDDFDDLHHFCSTNYSNDLLRVRKICQYLNGLEHRIRLDGSNFEAWDVAVFRVATITIAESEELPEPSGETIKL